MPDTKQRARVVGVIITQCPACNNTVNFDRVTKKICPYCGAENVALAPVNAEANAEHVCESCKAEVAEMDEACEAPAYASGPDLSPAEHRAEAIADDAETVLAHILASGVRFNARRKVTDAEEFSFLRGGSTLALPSKLSSVSAFQGEAEEVAPAVDAVGGYLPAVLHLAAYDDGRPFLLVTADAQNGDPAGRRTLGTIQPKHLPWILPLLTVEPEGFVRSDRNALRVYVTAVTGGTPERPTRGVNIVITGSAEAVRLHVEAGAEEAAREAAYESGDPVAIAALLA